MAGMGKEEEDCKYYKFAIDDIQKCDITKWYTDFEDVTVPTLTFSIAPELIKYITETSRRCSKTLANLSRLHMPSDAWSIDLEDLGKLTLNVDAEDDFSEDDHSQQVDEYDFSSDDDEDEDDDSDSIEIPQKEIIIETIVKIKFCINDLGGSVLPKLNWMAPKDAVRLCSDHSLKCQSSGKVLLLLKMSKRIGEFTDEGLKKYISNVPDPSPFEFHLVFRKWMDGLSLDKEFRCFVCDKRLTAICQRDIEVGYFAVMELRDSIIKDIHDFFCDYIHGRFPLNFYVFDVARLSPGRIILLDFGVFGLPTDPLLFTYRELKMFMDDRTSALKSKPPSFKSASGLRSVVTYGEPYFRYLTPDSCVGPLLMDAISPPEIATYLREGTADELQ